MKNLKTEKLPAANADNEAAVLEDTGMGEVKIHENVISMLVRKAALGVPGVSRLSGSQLVDIIAETVGSRRMQDRAISVEIGDNGLISLEVKINIKFGFKIPVVSAGVQKAVIAEVENTTGMTVTKVNVFIQEVEAEEEADEDASGSEHSVALPPQC